MTEAKRRQRLLEISEELNQSGSWEWIPPESHMRWSGNLFRIFGLDPGEIVPSPGFIVEQTHPDDRPRVARRMEELRAGAEPPAFEYRLARPDGSVRLLQCNLALTETRRGRPYRFMGSVRDLTDRLRADRQIAAHVAVSEAMAEWEGLEPGAARLLERLAEAMGFEAGVLWVPRGEVLVVRVQWSARPADHSEFEAVTRGVRFPRGSGLPGKAWRRLAPVALRSMQDLPNPRRRAAAVRAGLRGALALPVLHGAELLGVLEFYSREEVEMTERLLRSLMGISHQVGQVFDRRRGELEEPSLLTPRELEVLQLAAQGHSGPAIAELLVLSPATVKAHFAHIYNKLGVSDRSNAVAAAMRMGLID
jgi:PAS domain S-box-containing protein